MHTCICQGVCADSLQESFPSFLFYGSSELVAGAFTPAPSHQPCCLFVEKGSHIFPDWPQNCYSLGTGLELLILPCLSPECWDCILLHLVGMVQGIKPRPWCMLGKQSTNRVTLPVSNWNNSIYLLNLLYVCVYMHVFT